VLKHRREPSGRPFNVKPEPSIALSSSVRHTNAFAVAGRLVSPPATLLAVVFGFWRLGADLSWTGAFPIANGILSRYQVWFAIAIALHRSALILDRRTAIQRTWLQ
jgi:hypothetical protein